MERRESKLNEKQMVALMEKLDAFWHTAQRVLPSGDPLVREIWQVWWNLGSLILRRYWGVVD